MHCISQSRPTPLNIQAIFLQGHFLLVLSSVLVVSATPFPSAEVSASKVSATLDITTPLYPSNASFSTLDTTAENSLTIHCDGRTYGYYPSIRDCESLSEQLAPSDRIWTWKERSFDAPPGTAPLPFLVMGDQALCYAQVGLVGDNLSAKASSTMIRDATAALVTHCAKGIIPQGGIATNIGGDNHLAVVLRTYHRRPTCSEELAPWESCRHILATMPAGIEAYRFGPEAPDFVTPFRMPSGDGGCSAIIDIPGRAYEVASFYDIWVALTAVYAVCSRRNKSGVMRGLGEHSRIYVTMSANPRLELPGNTSVVATS